ncbi:MAG TPA: ABC transporter permease [Thermoanaerobaculia bacterium]|nr:ABC transporter permease [Thermoanaerobaculia bacterium]
MQFFTDTWTIFLRHVRATLRNPAFVIISIVQPILWLFLFGQLFSRVAAPSGLGSASYAQFLAPGIAIMAALFGTAFSGVGLLYDINQGVVDRFLATPVSRGAVIAGRLLDVALQAMIQALVLLLASFLVGARPNGGLTGVILVLVASGLLAIALASLSKGLALLLRNQEAVLGITNFVLLPMIFLSSMILSRDLMPHWIQVASAFNPVDWAVQVARASYEGSGWPVFGRELLQLTAFAAAGYALALGSLGKYQKSI